MKPIMPAMTPALIAAAPSVGPTAELLCSSMGTGSAEVEVAHEIARFSRRKVPANIRLPARNRLLDNWVEMGW